MRLYSVTAWGNKVRLTICSSLHPPSWRWAYYFFSPGISSVDSILPWLSLGCISFYPASLWILYPGCQQTHVRFLCLWRFEVGYLLRSPPHRFSHLNRKESGMVMATASLLFRSSKSQQQEKVFNVYETVSRFRDSTAAGNYHILGFCEKSISSVSLSLFIPPSLLSFCYFIPQIHKIMFQASVLFDKPAWNLGIWRSGVCCSN